MFGTRVASRWTIAPRDHPQERRAKEWPRSTQARRSTGRQGMSGAHDDTRGRPIRLVPLCESRIGNRELAANYRRVSLEHCVL